MLTETEHYVTGDHTLYRSNLFGGGMGFSSVSNLKVWTEVSVLSDFFLKSVYCINKA